MLVLWDAADDPKGNVQHIADNDQTPEEVEDVLLDSESLDDCSQTSGRPMKFGWPSTGRYIAVVYQRVGYNMVFPITAFEVENG